MGIDPVSLAVTVALNAASMAMTASQEIEGPRLDSLGVTTSDYGTPLPYAYGTKRLFGVSCIWAEPLREQKQQNKTKGGKYNDYKYFGTWAVLLTDHEIQAVSRIWFDKHLVYDSTGAGPISPFSLEGSITDYMRMYLGTDAQDPDPRIQTTVDAEFGAGSTPAYRGRSYVVFEDLPLEKLGNRLPQVDVEVVAVADNAYPSDIRQVTLAQPFSVGGTVPFGAAPDRSRFVWIDGQDYEIWDAAGRSQMIAGVLDDSNGEIRPSEVMAVAPDGKLYVLTYGSDFNNRNVVEYAADGVGASRLVTPDLFWASFVLYLDTDFGDYLGIARETDLAGGWIYQLATESLEFIDPVDYLGVDARVKNYFVDLNGNMWACCSGESLPLDKIGLIQLTGTRVGYIVDMPSTPIAEDAALNVWHYRDAEIDVFVTVRSAVTGGDHAWAHVDVGTMAVTSSADLPAYGNEENLTLILPGTRYLYQYNGRIDVKTLTVDQTWALIDWGVGPAPSSSRVFYDPINHAIFAADPVNADQVIWYYLDRISGSGVTLRSIVEDVAARSGLDVATDIDATALTQTVEGCSWVQGQGKAILEPLLEFFNSEVRPHDFTLQFIVRGAPTGGVIEVADMGAGGGDRYQIVRTLDTDLPLGVNVNFADPAMDQQPNSARSQRHAETTDGRREVSLDVTILVTSIDAARSAADGYLRRTWMQAETCDNALSRAYTRLEPGDVMTLDLDDIARTAKVARLEFGANGVLSLKWTRDGPAVHVAAEQPGAPADGFTPSEILTPAYSRGHVLDIPLAQDSHDGLVLYMAAGPYGEDVVWPGANVYESMDDGDTYSLVEGIGSDQQAIWGVASEVLPAALATVWDRASVVNVQVKAGALTSVTEAQAENGANMALIGSEIVHFTTAALQGDGSYDLSGFLRGRRGTEQHIAAHAAGERFVMLSPTIRHTMGVSDLTDDFVYKTVTSTSINQAGFTETLEFTGASWKPYSPAHAAVVDDAGDLVASWVRRTRLGGFNVNGTTPPLGESAEAYEVDVLDAGDVVLRTYSGLTTPEATYSAAHQASDGGAGAALRIYQISTSVGRGFPAEIAI